MILKELITTRNSNPNESSLRFGTTFVLKSCIALFLINVSCHGKLLEVTDNTTVVEGDRVILNCRTDLEFTVFWYFDGKEIFYGGKISMQYASKFDIATTTKGEYNLVIRNATKWYNGIYTCADDEGEGERRSAWLTVADPLDPASKSTDQKPQNTDAVPIVAIVTAVAVVLVIIIIIVIGVLCIRQRKQKLIASAHEDKEQQSTACKRDQSQKPTQAADGVIADNLPKMKDTINNFENISKQNQAHAIQTPPGQHYERYTNKVPVVLEENKPKEDMTYSSINEPVDTKSQENGDSVTDQNVLKRSYSESLLEDEGKVTETDTENIRLLMG